MSLSLSMLWLIAGSILCLMELFLPTAFVAFMMGISALVVGLLGSFGLTVFSLQVLLWLILSTLFVLLSRRLLPSAKASRNLDAKEGRTLTEIPIGESGRVLYEGNSWSARCADDSQEIGPNQKVYVVKQEGTTLIVIPQNVWHH